MANNTHTLRRPTKVKIDKNICYYTIGRHSRTNVIWKKGSANSGITRYYDVPGLIDVRVCFLKNDIGVKPRVITGSDIRLLAYMTGLVQRYSNPIMIDSCTLLAELCLTITRRVELLYRMWNSIAMWQCVWVEIGDLVIDRPVEYCWLHVLRLRNGQKMVELKLRESWLGACAQNGVRLQLPITGNSVAQNIILRTRGRRSEKNLHIFDFYRSVGLNSINKNHRKEHVVEAAWQKAKDWYSASGGSVDYSIQYEPPKIAGRRRGKGRRLQPVSMSTKVVRP